MSDDLNLPLRLRDPINAMTKDGCKKLMVEAADHIERLEDDLHAARTGLDTVISGAHAALAKSQTSIG